jgi:hypothetical protein
MVNVRSAKLADVPSQAEAVELLIQDSGTRCVAVRRFEKDAISMPSFGATQFAAEGKPEKHHA